MIFRGVVILFLHRGVVILFFMHFGISILSFYFEFLFLTSGFLGSGFWKLVLLFSDLNIASAFCDLVF